MLVYTDKKFVYNINGNLDRRSVFANKICSLLVSKHNGNIDAALEDFKPLNAEIHNYIRNVYELVDCEIPLMGLFDLLCYPPDNWDFTIEEHQSAIERAYEACSKMYVMPNLLDGAVALPPNLTREEKREHIKNTAKQYRIIPPLSIVKWIGNFNYTVHPFNTNDSYIYHGEIPNMPGHCVVSNMKTGQLYSGYHCIDFKVVIED